MAKFLETCVVACLLACACGDDSDIARVCKLESGCQMADSLLQLGADVSNKANCAAEPGSPNGGSHPRGCAGAVWTDGSPSKSYCSGSPHFDNNWWKQCCAWNGSSCLKKAQFTLLLDGQSCDNAYRISQSWGHRQSAQVCYEFCKADAQCTHFTWFEGVACRKFNGCPQTGRYTTDTQPSKTYAITQAPNRAPTWITGYSSPVEYTEHLAIAHNVPDLGGGIPSSCTSNPVLPDGLIIDAISCTISGTPKEATAGHDHITYTVTAANARGSSSTSVRIAIQVFDAVLGGDQSGQIHIQSSEENHPYTEVLFRPEYMKMYFNDPQQGHDWNECTEVSNRERCIRSYPASTGTMTQMFGVGTNNAVGRYRADVMIYCEKINGRLPYIGFYTGMFRGEAARNIQNVQVLFNGEIKHNWTDASDLVRYKGAHPPTGVPSVRVSVQFKALADPSFKFSVVAHRIYEKYDECVEHEEGIATLWSLRDSGGDALRTSNHMQLLCLKPDMPDMQASLPADLQSACSQWNESMSTATRTALTLILQAGRQHKESVASFRVRTHGSLVHDQEGCVNPDIAFVEEWSCGCYKTMKEMCSCKCDCGDCEACVSCFEHLLCNTDYVCNSWKLHKQCSLHTNASGCGSASSLLVADHNQAKSADLDDSILRKSNEC